MNMPFSEKVLTAAISYATELGWRITPLRNKGKVPYQSKWQEKATTNPEEIKEWIGGKENNIGIATGEESGIIVLDVDVKSGGLDTLKQWIDKHGLLPEVPVQQTGSSCPKTQARGRHYFFKYPTDEKGKPLEIGNKANIDPGEGIKVKNGQSGIDIRANGGQVVAAPSIHPSGTAYEWVLERSPFEVEPLDMPKWLLDLIVDKKPYKSKFRNTTKVVDSGSLIDLMDPVGEGGRNEALFKFASKLRGQKGLGESDILYFIKRANSERCSPPIPEREIQTIVASVCGRYSPKERLKKYRNKPRSKPAPKKEEEPWGDNMVSDNGTQPPEKVEIHRFMRDDDERYRIYDLILAWLDGVGPETPKLVWRDGPQAYSETFKRYMKAPEILKYHQPDILCWLAEKSYECICDPAEVKKKVTPVGKATKLWKHWSQTCFLKHLSRIPDKSLVNGVADSEKQKLASSIYAVLSKSIRVNDNTDQIPVNTTVLQQADDSTAPGWKRVGKYGAYVRNPKKTFDASIGLRYDFVVQVGATWLGELPRKRLSRLLRENSIATTGVIKDARRSVRCLMIDSNWLNEYHGYLAQQEEDQSVESSEEKSASQ